MPFLRPDGTPYPYDVRQAQLRKDRGFLGKHGLFKNAVLPTAAFVAAPFAAGALSGSAGAASSASAASGGGYSSPGVFGGLFGGGGSAAAGAKVMGAPLSKLWDVANLGVGAATSLLGMRSQNRAADKQTALAEREITARLAADAEARAEQRRQFDAMQANEARRIAAEDEDRAFDRRLVEAREGRMNAWRDSENARRARLAAFLGLG